MGFFVVCAALFGCSATIPSVNTLFLSHQKFSALFGKYHHDHDHETTPTTHVPDIQDFDDKDRHGYDFIYHDYHDLVLTIHDGNCYFISADDSREPLLDDNHVYWSWRQTPRDDAEELIRVTIAHNKTDVVRPTTLDAMRIKYQDLLADFHCAQKNVFEVDLEWKHLDQGHED